jgi:hypothetical protein
MKNLILFASITICLFACTAPAGNNHSANIDLVKNYVKSVEDLNFEGMGKYLDDNYIGMGPSYGDTIRKKEAIENWKANVTGLYEKIHYNRTRFVAVTIPDGENKGEWVANWAELNIVYKDKKGAVTIWANTNYLVENGKILRSITFYNEADALRQMGYKLVAPGESQ